MSILPSAHTVQFLGQLLDTKRSTLAPIEMTSFKPKYSDVLNGERLERATPESVGVPSKTIEKYLKKLKDDKSINIHSILIARHGKIICEATYGMSRLDVWKHSFSACKSVVSIAIGMLIDDGALTLDEKVVNIFSKETGPINKLKLKDLTVKDLLTMRSTVLFCEADVLCHEDWVKAFMNAATKGDVGKTFRYNSINTYMLSAIVHRKTGRSLTDFLDERLFSPLGIKDYYFERCPKGIEKGGWGLYIRPEDFAKIGTLMVNKGVYNGKRFLSEEYVNMAIMRHVDAEKVSGLFDYGYQIWSSRNGDSFLFNGMLGQNVYCFKNNGIVIVSHAGNSAMFQESNFFKYSNEAFSLDFHEKIDENECENRELNQYILNLSDYTREVRKPSLFHRILKPYDTKNDYKKHFEHLSGKTYKVASGHYQSVGLLPLIIQTVECSFSKGFNSLGFFTDGNGSPWLSYCESDMEIKIPLGFDKIEVFDLPYKNDNYKVAVRSRFAKTEDDESVLVISLDFLETPSRRIIKIYQSGEDEIRLFQTETPNGDFLIGIVDMFLSEFSENHIVNSIYDKIGGDFLDYKFDRMFSTTLTLKCE